MRLTEDELIRELRDERTEPDSEFATKLDEWAAAGFPRGEGPGPDAGATSRLRGRFAPGLNRIRERLSAAPPRRLLAPAGAAATLIVVAGVAISQSGGGSEETVGLGEPQVVGDVPAVSTESGGEAGALKEVPPGAELGSGTENSLDRDRVAIEGESRAGSLAEPGPAGRKVAQNVDLTLAAEPDEVRDVADGVNSVVNKYHGFVISSSVESGDSESGLGASFRIKIPAASLQAALADMSELAHVESRTEGTQDITARFLSAEERIEENEARRESLLKQLADADTATEKASVEAQLEIVNAELSAARTDLAEARERVQLVPVTVSIVAEEGAGDDGKWGLEEALEDAGDVLSAIAGGLLVGGAILVPLALFGGVAYAIRRRSVNRARDRALD